ncbi:hypothetical protein [Psychromonas antarctica]|uniref:hypothetical protein n=1 Tax=Psychromonas antarctica TaxID=67573 RepID=UPI001EE7A129|nr:hypothetical protein [Psychromonas antarctica]MCG6202900.1 hypothetical protein [Psychromonas antarctica]
MSTEILAVIDTAVKIGLGAIIAGVFTQLAAKRQFSNELEKRSYEDNKQLIKDTALNIGNSYTSLNKLAVILRNSIYHGKLEDNSVVVKESHACILESQNYLNTAMVNSTLLGVSDLRKEVESISFLLNKMLNIIDKGIFEQKSLELLQVESDTIEKVKFKLNKLITEAYKNA